MKLLPFERRWAVGIAEAILPATDTSSGPPKPADLPMERFVDAFFRRTPVESALGVRAAVWAITLAPLVWRAKGKPFGRLSLQDQQECLEAFQASPIYFARELPTLLKIVTCMGWAGFPEVQRDLGMPTADERPAPWTGLPDADPDDGVST
jgi:hypothetical protein